MAEKVLKQSEASYFKSATNVINGYVTLTNERLVFSGKLGDAVKEKLEGGKGLDNNSEETIFNIPIIEVNAEVKRFGLSKRLAIHDYEGNEYKLAIQGKKEERNSWPEAIKEAK